MLSKLVKQLAVEPVPAPAAPARLAAMAAFRPRANPAALAPTPVASKRDQLMSQLQQAAQAQASADAAASAPVPDIEAQTRAIVEDMRRQSDAALQRQSAALAEAARRADEAFNKANRKTPMADVASRGARQGGKGASGTLLTGTQGVEAGALTLGRNTLLGR